MKTNFKLGQKVYFQEMQGEVISICEDVDYQIYVDFGQGKHIFTEDGRHYINTPPVLSHTPYTLNGFSQTPVIEKDTMVWVRDNKDEQWMIRFYSHFEDGKHYCFNKQKKSHETENRSSWEYCQTENPFE